MTSKPNNSMPQDRGVGQEDLTPDPLPPDVKIIECSCAQAENRTDDNSKWVNVIREPIEVQKGSEIRVLSNYIDMRGIDQEIIQFQNTGSTQDNAHTLLTQLYTTNDGYNNKTTSYDYMSQGDGITIMDVGEDYPGSAWTTTGYGGSGTGADCFRFDIAISGLRPKNINITNGGKNYQNGERFTITSNPPGDDLSGRIITDDEGSIVKLIMTKAYSFVAVSAPNTLNFTDTLGSGATFNNIITSAPIAPNATPIQYTRTDARRGENYKYGDILTIEDDNTGTKHPEAKRATIRLNSIFSGPNAVNNQSHFDQGYNYQKTPVSRWAQTYELTSAFCYGDNTGTRTFNSHGQSVTISEEASHQINDKCLSASNLILNKEDVFAPGIYHKSGANGEREFTLNKPVLYFGNATRPTGDFQFQYDPTLEGGSWVMELQNGNSTETINGNVVQINPFNIMALGSVWQFTFEFENVPSPTQLQTQQLSAFATQYSNTTRVKRLIQEQETFSNPGVYGTRVVFNNNLKDYTGEISNYVLGTTLSGTGIYPNNSTFEVDLVYNSAEDGGSAPTQNFTALFNTDGTGVVQAYAFSTNKGLGLRRGMIFTIDQTQYPGALETILVTQVDETGGWNFPAPLNSVLDNNSLVTSAGDTLRMFITPVLNHSNLTETTSLEDKGNRIGFRQKNATHWLYDNYPLTFEDAYLKKSSDIIPGGRDEPNVANGVYKPAGLTDSTDTYFSTDQGALVNHDTEIDMEISADNSNLLNYTMTYGQNAIDVIFPWGNPALQTDDWLQGVGEYNIRIHTANWNIITGSAPFPTYTTLQIESVNNTSTDVYLQTGGVYRYDGIFTYIEVLSNDILATQSTTQFMSGNTTTITGLTRVIPTNNDFRQNLNGLGITYVKFTYSPDIKNHNTQIGCKWNDMTGSIGVTGQQNFFNDNDPNKSVMINEKLYKVPPLIRKAYNEGGFYFFTHLQGILSTQDGTELNYDLQPLTNGGDTNIANQFNQGFDYWLFGQLSNAHYSWRTDYQTPNDLNYNQSLTNITKFWKYEPLYRQKFFSIDKNFCVASDISGIWTREAHKLTGAINPINGEEYTSAKETGILQNEFINPVYGSNNLISSSGEYIKDDTIYPDTDGLEPGHSVGIQYLTSNTRWLAGDLIKNLPEDENNKKFYYVFFRTTWTKIRGYDPLKSDGAGNPDFTAIETVNQDAYKIGNANPIGISTSKALNGDTLLETTNANPPAAPPLADNKAYELGEAGGVNVGGSAVKFGEKNNYPIYYLDENTRDLYPKAKLSQYVGSTNLTLAFATDISTFTFQFLHQPYTSPFVDGEGGTNSIRVFFGNRKSGIENHETLGGLVVVNYARPDFPRNTFTLTEINNNPTFINGISTQQATNNFTTNQGQFIYGIDPLKSVGYVGRQFMNKLGFTDSDIGVSKGQLISSTILPSGGFTSGLQNQLNYKLTEYSRDITTLLDGTPPSSVIISSYDTEFYGTTGSDIDSSDAILAEIPAPEANAGLESHNVKTTPNVGSSNSIIQKFGDFIFYPYSINATSNSFADTALVRYDNASSTYGAIGGLLLSNSNRGMGIPNTVGSTFIVDDSSIPRTLNPDCELYLAYTIACSSSLKQASILPQRLTNAYLVVLSSLMKETNLYMPKAGFVNAMSIVSKTFLQGDFILSQGQLSFYAKEDFMLSQIETEIKDTNFTSPSTLGINSSVIYQITNYNPVPKKQLATIEQEQEQDYQIMEAMSAHMDYLNGNVPTSDLNELNKDLYSLGLNVLTGGGKNLDVIGAIRNQIQTHDLPSLTPGERNRFLQTPEGQILVQNSADLAVINSQIGSIAQAQNDVGQVYGGEQRLQNITRMAQREIRERESQIRERTPINFFNPPAQDVTDFYNDLPQPQQSLILQEKTTTKSDMPTFPSMMPELLDKVFTSKEDRDSAETKMKELNTKIKSIRKNVKSPEKRTERGQYETEKNTLLNSLTGPDSPEKETPTERARREGRNAVRTAGYTPQDIANMEAYGYRNKFGEAISRRSQAYRSAQADSPFKPAYSASDSGVATSVASSDLREEE